MKKERFILNLIVFLILVTCKKEAPDDIPDYQPGRLTEVSYETPDFGLSYHKYEYKESEVTDYWYFISSEVFITEYHFKNDILDKVYYSLENTNEEFNIDSLIYIYSDSIIFEVNHYTDASCDTIVYFIENGEIVSSTNRPESSSTEYRIDHFCRWSGENLIQYIEHIWIQGYCIETNCVFQYSTLENPLFYCNIPKLMNVFTPPQGSRILYYELTDLVPKCSKNFPSKVTVYYNYIPEIDDVYNFEIKKFLNDNKPYIVRVVHTQYFTDYYEYFLTYEEL